MSVEMTNQLPPSRIRRRHRHRLHLPWIQGHSWRYNTFVDHIVSMEM